MKRVIVLFVAAMLCAAPAFAAGKAGEAASGRQSGGTIKGSANITTVTGSTLLNVGDENKTTIGGMKAANGGKIEGSANVTTMTGSTILNVGNKNETEIGVMKAE